jgi:hypothetical protein
MFILTTITQVEQLGIATQHKEKPHSLHVHQSSAQAYTKQTNKQTKNKAPIKKRSFKRAH